MKSNLSLDLHLNQHKVFNDRSRTRLLVASRRWGKSRLLLTEIIYHALSFDGHLDPLSPPVVLLACPTLKQCRSIHWRPLVKLLEDQPFVKTIDRSDLRIDFYNKPSILLRGANDSDGDGLRGLKLYYVGLDEIQDVKQAAWEQSIYPALADTPNSRSLLIGTPKGQAHWLYTHLRKSALTLPDWGYHHYTALQNPTLPRSFILRAKRDLPDRVFKQELLADFLIFEGQFFDHFNSSSEVDILPNQFEAVFISLDHGSQNPAIVVTGFQDKVYYTLDTWENPHPGQSVTVDEIVTQVARFARQYSATRVFSPDDRPDILLSIRRHGIKNNIQAMRIVAEVKRSTPGVIARIEIANSLFKTGRLFIHSKQKKLISTLQSYRRAQNALGQYIDKVEEGQDDHLIDALLYCLARLEYKNNILSRPDLFQELDEGEAA